MECSDGIVIGEVRYFSSNFCEGCVRVFGVV